jgi:UDP-N-acetylglucosamine 3-dehydrogenase
VIGAGAMGRNHARAYGEVAGAELVGVADIDRARATEIAGRNGARAYTDYREMLEREKPIAVSVVVPTRDHVQVAMDALARGCHVLVEKPIASTIEEAERLVEAARVADRILMVGHIERFNPALVELKSRLDAGQLGRVYQARASRLGPFPNRVRDVGVVVDLATHDLDIIRYLAGSEPVRVFGETKREIHTSHEDMLSGLVRFENGVLGVLEINWLTPTKIRELKVTGERGMFQADYLTQDLYFFENADADETRWGELAVLRGVNEGSMTRYAIPKREPLRAELESFLAAVSGDTSSVVSGSDGLAALRMALALIRSGETHEAVAL